MRFTTALASTHRDRHGDVITKEALEACAKQVDQGPEAVAFTINHDRTLPPLGKGIGARVEPCGDGEFRLVADTEVFDTEDRIVLDDGTELAACYSTKDQRPFVSRDTDEGEPILKVAVDLTNIGSPGEFKSILQEVRAIDDCDCRTYGRKSLIPDPEATITVGQKIVEYLSQRVLDAAVEAALVAAFGLFLRQAKALLRGYHKIAVPRNRPATYLLVIPGTPVVEFAAQGADVEMVLAAIEDERLPDAYRRAVEVARAFDARKVQFLLSEDGNWEFNYLLTRTGGVVSTIQRRRRAWDEFVIWLKSHTRE